MPALEEQLIPFGVEKMTLSEYHTASEEKV
jgi:hypothetical protein